MDGDTGKLNGLRNVKYKVENERRSFAGIRFNRNKSKYGGKKQQNLSRETEEKNNITTSDLTCESVNVANKSSIESARYTKRARRKEFTGKTSIDFKPLKSMLSSFSFMGQDKMKETRAIDSHHVLLVKEHETRDFNARRGVDNEVEVLYERDITEEEKKQNSPRRKSGITNRCTKHSQISLFGFQRCIQRKRQLNYNLNVFYKFLQSDSKRDKCLCCKHYSIEDVNSEKPKKKSSFVKSQSDNPAAGNLLKVTERTAVSNIYLLKPKDGKKAESLKNTETLCGCLDLDNRKSILKKSDGVETGNVQTLKTRSREKNIATADHLKTRHFSGGPTAVNVCEPVKICKRWKKVAPNVSDTGKQPKSADSFGLFRTAIKYFLVVTIVIIWLPCILVLGLVWLITYPYRPHQHTNNEKRMAQTNKSRQKPNKNQKETKCPNGNNKKKCYALFRKNKATSCKTIKKKMKGTDVEKKSSKRTQHTTTTTTKLPLPESATNLAVLPCKGATSSHIGKQRHKSVTFKQTSRNRGTETITNATKSKHTTCSGCWKKKSSTKKPVVVKNNNLDKNQAKENPKQKPKLNNKWQEIVIQSCQGKKGRDGKVQVSGPKSLTKVAQTTVRGACSNTNDLSSTSKLPKNKSLNNIDTKRDESTKKRKVSNRWCSTNTPTKNAAQSGACMYTHAINTQAAKDEKSDKSQRSKTTVKKFYPPPSCKTNSMGSGINLRVLSTSKSTLAQFTPCCDRAICGKKSYKIITVDKLFPPLRPSLRTVSSNTIKSKTPSICKSKEKKQEDTEGQKEKKVKKAEKEKDAQKGGKTEKKDIKKIEKEADNNVKKREKEVKKKVEKPEKDKEKSVKKAEDEKEKGLKKAEKEKVKSVEKPEKVKEKSVKKAEKEKDKSVKKSEKEKEKSVKKAEKEKEKIVKKAEKKIEKSVKKPEKEKEKSVKKPIKEKELTDKKKEQNVKKPVEEKEQHVKKPVKEKAKPIKKSEKENKKVDNQKEKKVKKYDKPFYVKKYFPAPAPIGRHMSSNTAEDKSTGSLNTESPKSNTVVKFYPISHDRSVTSGVNTKSLKFPAKANAKVKSKSSSACLTPTTKILQFYPKPRSYSTGSITKEIKLPLKPLKKQKSTKKVPSEKGKTVCKPPGLVLQDRKSFARRRSQEMLANKRVHVYKFFPSPIPCTRSISIGVRLQDKVKTHSKSSKSTTSPQKTLFRSVTTTIATNTCSVGPTRIFKYIKSKKSFITRGTVPQKFKKEKKDKEKSDTSIKKSGDKTKKKGKEKKPGKVKGRKKKKLPSMVTFFVRNKCSRKRDIGSNTKYNYTKSRGVMLKPTGPLIRFLLPKKPLTSTRGVNPRSEKFCFMRELRGFPKKQICKYRKTSVIIPKKIVIYKRPDQAPESSRSSGSKPEGKMQPKERAKKRSDSVKQRAKERAREKDVERKKDQATALAIKEEQARAKELAKQRAEERAEAIATQKADFRAQDLRAQEEMNRLQRKMREKARKRKPKLTFKQNARLLLQQLNPANYKIECQDLISRKPKPCKIIYDLWPSAYPAFMVLYKMYNNVMRLLFFFLACCVWSPLFCWCFVFYFFIIKRLVC